MPKVPAKLIKGLMKKLGSGISEETNAKHEEMIKAMRAKQVPDTADVERAMAKPAMEEAPKAVEVADDEIRPEIANMNKFERKAWLEKYKATPDEKNPFKTPGGGIEPNIEEKYGKQQPPIDLPEGESDAIDSIMKLMQEAKKKKK